MSIPRATVRLQFNSSFTLLDAIPQVDYFADLGISHIYASPLLTARKGSTHGYDIVDPTRVSEELGGEPALRALVDKLRSRGMGLVMDIVPNHMGVGTPENRWWKDVLEWGRDSDYAHWFDIDWNAADTALTGKLLQPFLGEPYGDALRDGKLALVFDEACGEFDIGYYDNRYPLAPQTYADVLEADAVLRDPAAAAVAEKTDPKERHEALKAFLKSYARDEDGRAAIDRVLQAFDAKAPEGAARLHALLERQHYRLTWWRNAAEEINWRRFFEVSDLAGIRVERDDVFEATHATILRLYAEGLLDGLRLDHVDGLAHPGAYCRKLRARLTSLEDQRPADAPRGPAYIVVEKILTGDETLRTDWGIDGTTGYEFMNQVGALLHDPEGCSPILSLWHEATGDAQSFETQVRSARRQLLAENFVGELEALVRALRAVARSDLATRDIAASAIRRVLTEVLVSFPAYRSYVSEAGGDAHDRALLQTAIDEARACVRAADMPVLDALFAWLGGEAPQDVADEAARTLRLAAIRRFQQLTPPLAAKAVEDTTFYRYGPLLSRNEVGADPGRFSLKPEAFHRANEERARDFPHNLLATATHDHKRGEDARARLAALSELPHAWAESVRRWMGAHAARRATLPDGRVAPTPADELMLYQTLLGAWPFALSPDDGEGVKAYAERIAAWQEKALREAKRVSSWVLPDADYESACRAFLDALFADAGFIRELRQWVDRLALPTVCNSLAQTLLRLASPGVPDLYQGTEYWDFSLVDPDNRRPVDYAARAASLQSEAAQRDFDDMLWQQGQIKQTLIARMLALREKQPALFADGDYLPLQVSGPQARHVIAFLRRHGGQTLLVAALRLPARGPLPDGDGSAWDGTELLLPQAMSGWRDVLSPNATVGLDGERIALGSLLDRRPVAVLLTGGA
ncbi:malto-oligosyltrehalose synthase [Noviherbaspirillum pedocola]|uniref:Malto-oligosyltrehalose synthase n=1 Tax=Noviherbaspirillum pedocola TaxID=2801341 RepID=A0A934W861_9BURK|nr:malto-oligosyltrehalose synthase [Noviherbaspirillum pedocola]MBK4738237.1 malto-oligosyltrehalose synthase [Noviherbaspirillum pedocola]